MRKKAKSIPWGNTGARIIFNPNGSNEIWIKDERGNTIPIEIGVGPYGLGIRMRAVVGATALTVGGNAFKSYAVKHCGDFSALEITVYNHDADSQRFKEKYAKGKL